MTEEDKANRRLWSKIERLRRQTKDLKRAAPTIVGGSGVTLSDATPQPLGTAAAGDGGSASRDDHVHAMPALRALSDYNDTTPPTDGQVPAWDTDTSKWIPTTPAGGGAALSDDNPQALGTAAPGTSEEASRADHVHPTTGLALASHTHTREAIFTFITETLEDGMVSPVRLYNTSGASRTITKVYASVSDAPGGQAIIVDVKLNDVSIFSAEINRPQIAVSAFYGDSTTIGTPTWPANQYLTAHVPQAGTTTAGANLVVYVAYTG